MNLSSLKFPAVSNIEPFKLTTSGGHIGLKTINNLPSSKRQNISIMIAIAKQIVKAINGLNDTRYTVNVRQGDKLVCSVYPTEIVWQPKMENLKAKYNPKEKITNF